MEAGRASGAWKKFPKHEQVKMGRYLDRIKIYYGGVLTIKAIPAALVVVDVKKEEPAVREGKRVGVPVIGMVDTNSDPTPIDYVIPANDDAVGSIQYVIHALAAAYGEGKTLFEKSQKDLAAVKTPVAVKPVEVKVEKKVKTKKAWISH